MGRTKPIAREQSPRRRLRQWLPLRSLLRASQDPFKEAMRRWNRAHP